MGKSYQEPLVIRNTEITGETVKTVKTSKTNKTEETDVTDIIGEKDESDDENKTEKESKIDGVMMAEKDKEGREGKGGKEERGGNEDREGRDRGEKGGDKKKRKKDEKDFAESGVKKNEKDKKDKRKRKKQKKEKNSDTKIGNNDSDKSNSNYIKDNNEYYNGNNNVYDSDSSSEWSGDNDNNNNNNKNNKNNKKAKYENQMVAYSENTGDNTNMNKEIIFLPDGRMLVQPSNQNNKNNKNGPEIPDVVWGTDHRGEESIRLHGVYAPDVPVYTLFIGGISREITGKREKREKRDERGNIGNIGSEISDTYSTVKSNISNRNLQTNSTYISSFSLAKKSHSLPTGAIFMDENSPRGLFRPIEKSIIEKKNDKKEILKEIRLRKRERYFISGRYYCENDDKNDDNGNNKIRIGGDILSDQFVKRIRYDRIRKNKRKINILNQNNSNINTNNFGFLKSEFLPLPVFTISGIVKEFTVKNTDLKPEITFQIEKKTDRATFFGFGGATEKKDEKNDLLSIEKDKIENEKKKKMEEIRKEDEETEKKEREIAATIFSSDAEVLF